MPRVINSEPGWFQSNGKLHIFFSISKSTCYSTILIPAYASNHKNNSNLAHQITWQMYLSWIQQCGHVGSFKVQVHGFCGIIHQHMLYAGMNMVHWYSDSSLIVSLF